MKSIHNAASAFFIGAVAVLSVISILGVWDFFSNDVIWKSFLTLGLLAVIAVVIIVAGRFIENKDAVVAVPQVPNPIFKSIRQITLGVLIISATLLALVGVMVIWDVITDSEVLFKSLSSLGILAFSSFVIVVTCLDLEREDNPLLKNHGKKSGWIILLVIVLAWMFFGFLRSLMYGFF
jgi:hypothetical protein